MKTRKGDSKINYVVYNFRKNASLNIDVVPIAERLLTEKSKVQTTAPHRTNFYRIICFEKGEPVHTVDFEKIRIKSPAVLFVHKDKIHKFDKEAAHDGKVLVFTDDFFFRTDGDRNFLRNAQILNQSDTPILLSNVDENLRLLFDQIEREIKQEEQLFKSEVLHHLLNALLYSAERIASIEYPKSFNQTANAMLVNSFLEAVEENYKNRLSIEKYAALLSVTVNKLNSALGDIKGKTGKQIVTERLLLEAKRLLVYSDLNAKEIGYELGFDEPTNFIKFIKKNIKQTPLEFQEANR